MTETPAIQRIKKVISENDIVLFMRGNRPTPLCGFSAMVVQTLSRLGIRDFKDVDVLADSEIGQGVKEFSKWPTFPQLFVKGEFVGGFDIVQDMFKTGALQEFFVSKGILTNEVS